MGNAQSSVAGIDHQYRMAFDLFPDAFNGVVGGDLLCRIRSAFLSGSNVGAAGCAFAENVPGGGSFYGGRSWFPSGRYSGRSHRTDHLCFPL